MPHLGKNVSPALPLTVPGQARSRRSGVSPGCQPERFSESGDFADRCFHINLPFTTLVQTSQVLKDTISVAAVEAVATRNARG